MSVRQQSAVECDDPRDQQETRDDEQSDPGPKPRSTGSALGFRLANPISTNRNDSSAPDEPKPR